MIQITSDTTNAEIIQHIYTNVEKARGANFLIGFTTALVDGLASRNKKESREYLEQTYQQSINLLMQTK
jgi:hypothetical protein